MDALIDKFIEQSAGPDCGVVRVDMCRLLLVGQLEDVGGTVVKFATVAGLLLFSGPVGIKGPDGRSAPGVVAHDEDGGGVPFAALFEFETKMGEVSVS